MKFEGKTFLGETISLDYNDFVKCEFRDCNLIYHGFGTVGIVDCSFYLVRWTFSDAASHTIDFLTALYSGSGEGGKKLIESTFANIRSGKIPHKPQT